MTAELLNLPGVTLCAVDDRTPELARWSMRRSMQRTKFARAVLFTDASSAKVLSADDGIETIDIGPIGSVQRYSEVMLRGLQAHLHTPHVLVTQWDGFVLDPAAWAPEFLAFDYIGAPWAHFPPDRAVGNGGFSLRSQRLLNALLDPTLRVAHPEDTCICHMNRDLLTGKHGVHIAPVDIASRFAREYTAVGVPAFGFHGFQNFANVLDPTALHEFIQTLPDSMTRNLDARDLARQLIDRAAWNSAWLLIRKRFAAGLRDERQWKLAWHWWRSRLLARNVAPDTGAGTDIRNDRR